MKLLIVILISFMFFGCLKKEPLFTIKTTQKLLKTSGSGSGADRVPGDGAGSAGGHLMVPAGSTAGSSDGNGSDG